MTGERTEWGRRVRSIFSLLGISGSRRGVGLHNSLAFCREGLYFGGASVLFSLCVDFDFESPAAVILRYGCRCLLRRPLRLLFPFTLEIILCLSRSGLKNRLVFLSFRNHSDSSLNFLSPLSPLSLVLSFPATHPDLLLLLCPCRPSDVYLFANVAACLTRRLPSSPSSPDSAARLSLCIHAPLPAP